jgi:3-oxoacyl-(acyl-carrier-protein) synthase
VVNVVVTGMAWTTPLGEGLDAVWRLLCAGAGGIAPVVSPHPVRTPLAATVPFPGYGTAPPEERQVELTVRTLAAAFADAGLAADNPAATLVLGTSYGGQLDAATRPARHWTRRAAHALGHTGTPLCVTTACSAGADSVVVAEALIRTGRAEVCVAGGADVLSEAKRLGHTALGTMSSTGLRAFDTGHDGMVLGEGAAFLVLEAEPHARARGARVHARLDGTGSANDAHGLTAPDPTGDSVVAAVRRCPSAAGGIALVCAHGTGTPANDEVETVSLNRLFADRGSPPVVFGTKGALGHSLGATGAIEAVATVLALRHRAVPPLAGTLTPVPALRLPTATGTAHPVGAGAGLSLTLGFGGFHTCLCFSAPEPGRDGEEEAEHRPPAAERRGPDAGRRSAPTAAGTAHGAVHGAAAHRRAARPTADGARASHASAASGAGAGRSGPGHGGAGHGGPGEHAGAAGRPHAVAVRGRAVLTAADPAAHSANRPSFYADPVAWLVADAAERALDDSGRRDELLAARDDVAVVVLTGAEALPTPRAIAARAATGRVSPLRFAGANPGILAGLACIRLRLRGPSLVLADADDAAVAAALTVAGFWLHSGRARHAVVVRHEHRAEGHTARAVVLWPGPQPHGPDARTLLGDRAFTASAATTA